MRRTLSWGTAVVVTLGLLAAGPVASASVDSGAEPATKHGGTTAAPRAGGAVVVGATGPASGLCGTDASWVQKALAPGVTSYVVPGAGVITSVSHFAHEDSTGSIRAEFLGPGPGPDDWVVRAYTPLLPLTPGTVNTHPLRIPVTAGTSLGLFVPGDNAGCMFPGVPADTVAGINGSDPSTTPMFTASVPFPGSRLNLSAVWEPDADGDGFGDASQDACPQSPAIQVVACPAPDTTVTKAPKKKSAKRQAKVTFSSTVAGSTFTCLVDKLAAVACTSPFKKKYKLGKHTVVITATSPFGIVDPTPVTVSFKVTKPKPKS